LTPGVYTKTRRRREKGRGSHLDGISPRRIRDAVNVGLHPDNQTMHSDTFRDDCTYRGEGDGDAVREETMSRVEISGYTITGTYHEEAQVSGGNRGPVALISIEGAN